MTRRPFALVWVPSKMLVRDRWILSFRNEQKGGFSNLSDFARRVDLRVVGKRALESLIKVGALDSFGLRRALLEALDRLIGLSSGHQRMSQNGQMNLFGGDGNRHG